MTAPRDEHEPRHCLCQHKHLVDELVVNALAVVIANVAAVPGFVGDVPVPGDARIPWSFATLCALLSAAAAMMPPRTILVVHPPPRGVLDAVLGRFHVGSINLRHFIESVQPRLVICGHIHECAGIGAIGKTRVVNCSMSRNHNGALIDIIPQKELKIALI